MAELTIQIPDDLAERLQPVQNQLIEIIELGLSEISRSQNALHSEVIEFLASGPAPQAIIDFHPSAEARARVVDLLNKNQRGTLSAEEQGELDQYENLDFIMTLVKARARRHLASAS